MSLVVAAPAGAQEREQSTSYPVRLTYNSQTDRQPSWGRIRTPPVEKIVFASERDGQGEIYIMNTDGSSQTNLTKSPWMDLDPCLSKDGAKIAYESYPSGDGEIYIMNSDGTSQVDLTNNPADDYDPSFSRDRSKLAFTSNRDGNWDIFLTNSDGSGQINLTNNPAEDRVPSFSPDGSKIAFASDRNGNSDIYVMNVDGSGVTRLTNDPAMAYYPSFSPDGSKIAFVSYRDGNLEVYVMNSDGSGQTNLTNNPANDSFPTSFSPDGSRIAFTSERDGNEEIYVFSPPSLEPIGASKPGFVASVPGPDEISTDPEVIGTNVFLALFIILAFAFTSTLFNRTLRENRREIEEWAGQLSRPFRRLSGLVGKPYGVAAARRPLVRRLVGPATILLLTGLIYGLLSPDFGFNTKSVVLFASMVMGVGAITYLYEGGKALIATGRFGLRAGVKVYGLALAIAAVCVLISRVVDFQPGFLYGFVASYTLLARAAPDRRQSGQIVFLPAVGLLAFSVIAWLLVIPLREVSEGSDTWWVVLPEGAAVAVFVAGLQGVFFNMIPLTFFDGAKMAEWNRWVWFALFGVAGFLFWHVLLNKEGAYLGALPDKRVITALSLLSFYSVVSLTTWAYFRRRVYGSALPSLAAGGWARGAARISWRRRPR